jgi:hypothetical protein
MTVFFSIPCSDFSGQNTPLTIATGPVIIDHTHTKILLHKGKSTNTWQFIGWRYDDTLTFRENALFHAKSVVGSDIQISLDDEEHPLILLDTLDQRGYPETVLLIHYRAHINRESDLWDAAWFTLEEIRVLDAKNETSSPNIRIVSEKFLTHL